MKESERVRLCVIGRSALTVGRYFYLMFEQEINLWGLVPGSQCMALYYYCYLCFVLNLYTLTELSHLVPLGVAGKRTKEE